MLGCGMKERFDAPSAQVFIETGQLQDAQPGVDTMFPNTLPIAYLRAQRFSSWDPSSYKVTAP